MTAEPVFHATGVGNQRGEKALIVEEAEHPRIESSPERDARTTGRNRGPQAD
jgi:hypothetical protein